MATYYTLFAVTINNLSVDELTWCITRIALLEKDDDQRTPEENAELKATGYDGDGGCLLSVTSCTDESGDDRLVHLYSEEDGNVGHLALFFQEFLKRFRPTEIIAFQWAVTANKPVTEAFGGGACVVTAAEFRWLHTSNWVIDQVNDAAMDGKTEV
jgi:hypothetical protein